MPDAGAKMPDAGCKMQDAGCKIPDARCPLLVIGGRIICKNSSGETEPMSDQVPIPNSHAPLQLNNILYLWHMTLILISIILVGLAFAGIAIKLLVKKNGRFSGTCSANNPLLKNEGGVCSVCGARQGEECKN
jgi:hypothetical protein